MEFYTELQSECGNQTTAGSETVRGCKKSIQNVIEPRSQCGTNLP